MFLKNTNRIEEELEGKSKAFGVKESRVKQITILDWYCEDPVIPGKFYVVELATGGRLEGAVCTCKEGNLPDCRHRRIVSRAFENWLEQPAQTQSLPPLYEALHPTLAPHLPCKKCGQTWPVTLLSQDRVCLNCE